MNQILSTSNNQNNNKRNIDTRKIIVSFCVIILLFGMVITGMNVYSLYKEKSKDPIVENLNKPEVEIQQLEDGNLKIVAKYDQGIAKISYIWDDNNRTDTNGNGKTYVEKLIEISSNNKLEVIVIGNDGKTTTLSKEFNVEGDTIDPVIDWTISNNLLIIATDETEIAYLTYKWENEEEVMIKPKEDSNKKIIEKTIEVKRGTNELTITAVDASGNTAQKTRTFQGVNEPQISWMRYGKIVEVTAIHDMGFEKVILIVNGVEYVYDKNSIDYDKVKTEVKIEAEIQNGENTIIVKAYSNEGSEKIKEGKATYNP